MNATVDTCEEMNKRSVFARELGVPIIMHDYLIGGFTTNTSLAHYCRDNGVLCHFHHESCEFTESYVFGKQSPGLGHCNSICEAPLLPKLRGYFFEFIREICLAPLGILYLPTCVDFGYRYLFVEGRL